MLRAILYLIFAVFLIMVLGSVVLNEFPQLQPLVDEGVYYVKTLYNISLVKYGAIPTLVFIIALGVFMSDSKRR